MACPHKSDSFSKLKFWLFCALRSTIWLENATDRGHLNSDLHADGANKAFTTYLKGRAETDNTGELTAEFDGAHGWFWHNRSDEAVEVTLSVSGDYSEIKRVI